MKCSCYNGARLVENIFCCNFTLAGGNMRKKPFKRLRHEEEFKQFYSALAQQSGFEQIALFPSTAPQAG